jgi:hypothetical protein
MKFRQLSRRWYRYLAPIMFAIATIFVILAYVVRVDDPGLAELFMATGGWVLTFTGILLAGQYALRGLVIGTLSNLLEDEADEEQRKAKELVSRVTWAGEGKFSDNPYAYVRRYINKLGDMQQQELDKARRRLTHFWYRAARLVELDVHTPDEIFASVGPPEILEALEALETIKAERIAENANADLKPRPWPPMNLLIEWYKQEGRYEEARKLRPEVPAQPDLYRKSQVQK